MRFVIVLRDTYYGEYESYVKSSDDFVALTTIKNEATVFDDIAIFENLKNKFTQSRHKDIQIETIVDNEFIDGLCSI